MAKAEQITSLIASHIQGDDEHFRAVALQLAADVARAGHTSVARSIKDLLGTKKIAASNHLKMMNSEVQDYLWQVDSPFRLSDLVVPAPLHDKIQRIVHEYI